MEKVIKIIGWMASFMAVAMYVSYIDQIKLNLSGNSGSVVQPVVTVLNCSLWILYASLPKRKDLPLIICNIPGVILGFITAITAVLF